MRPPLMLAILLFTGVTNVPPADAFFQDKQLESALGSNDASALALFPAQGFQDGAAGFFRNHGLRIVAGSQRAWCQEQERGVLKPGCYVEFYFQVNGRRTNSADGSPCGLLGRWRQAPGSKTYAPTPGAFYSRAIASGNWEAVVLAFEERRSEVRLSDSRRVDECVARFEQ
jgi:hypothetical protein